MPRRLEDLVRDAITAWLRETDPSALETLWQRADQVRQQQVGDAVHLRGLIEISNSCVRQCPCCRIASCAGPIPCFPMTKDEIVT